VTFEVLRSAVSFLFVTMPVEMIVLVALYEPLVLALGPPFALELVPVQF